MSDVEQSSRSINATLDSVPPDPPAQVCCGQKYYGCPAPGCAKISPSLSYMYHHRHKDHFEHPSEVPTAVPGFQEQHRILREILETEFKCRHGRCQTADKLVPPCGHVAPESQVYVCVEEGCNTYTFGEGQMNGHYLNIHQVTNKWEREDRVHISRDTCWGRCRTVFADWKKV